MNNSKKKKTKVTVDWQKLEVLHPNAAGIDVGGSEHFVAIPPERDDHPVRSFACFTADLYRLADWLKEKGVDTVAMQSTGSYWVPLYEVLAQCGFQVFLVNAHHTKNLPGRKSDVQECQWLLKLHTFGLLNNSFQPSDEIRVLRTLWRHRAGLVAEASSCIQRIQKAMTEMNMQLCNVISDLSGATGIAILDAILSGERDGWKLAALAHPGVKAKPAEIAASLQGNWRDELLFVIEQQLEVYRFYQRKIGQCDRKLQVQMRSLQSKVDVKAQPLGPRRKGKKAQGNAPKFDLRLELYRTTGVDWTKVDGIDVMVAQTVIAETGMDMQAWPSEGHFASWLGLCPINDISGGRVLRRGTRRVLNRATVAFRQAASTLLRSESYLGAQYRRLRTRLGAPKAIKAMANKLARIFYRLLKYGEEYVDKGIQYYEQKYREQQIRFLNKKAAQLGFEIQPKVACVQ